MYVITLCYVHQLSPCTSLTRVETTLDRSRLNVPSFETHTRVILRVTGDNFMISILPAVRWIILNHPLINFITA